MCDLARSHLFSLRSAGLYEPNQLLFLTVSLPESARILAALTIHPLSLAIDGRHTACVDLLLRSGANPNRRHFLGSEINLVPLDNLACLEVTSARFQNIRIRAYLNHAIGLRHYTIIIDSILPEKTSSAFSFNFLLDVS